MNSLQKGTVLPGATHAFYINKGGVTRSYSHPHYSVAATHHIAVPQFIITEGWNPEFRLSVSGCVTLDILHAGVNIHRIG